MYCDTLGASPAGAPAPRGAVYHNPLQGNQSVSQSNASAVYHNLFVMYCNYPQAPMYHNHCKCIAKELLCIAIIYKSGEITSWVFVKSE